MTGSNDYRGEMDTVNLIDDAAAEALLAGHPVADDLAPLAHVVATYREAACQPVRPTGELAARMATGAFISAAGRHRPAVDRTERPRRLAVAITKWRRTRMALLSGLATAAAKLGGLSLAAKASAGVTIALASVGTAGVAGALPEPVQDRFDTVVESVTGDETPDPAGENAEFGERVSEDARDGGVDGADISEQARRQGEQRRPGELPDRVPDSVPGQPGGPSELPTPDDAADRKPADPSDQRPDSAPAGPGNQPSPPTPSRP